METLRQDYVTLARAKGQRESVVVTKHALRNAIIPVVSLLAVLELIKESLIELVQSEPFAPIYIKSAGSPAVLEEEVQTAAGGES